MKQAIILVAGRSSRLKQANAGIPKSLITFGNSHLLGMQVRSLLDAGVSRILFIVGFKQHFIRAYIESEFPGRKNFIFIENPRWRKTNVLGSLYCAKSYLTHETVILHGDTLYPPQLIRELVAKPVQSARLVVQRKKVGDEEMKYVTDGSGSILVLSKLIEHARAEGEFMGISYISRQFAQRLRAVLERESFREFCNQYYEWGLMMVHLIYRMQLQAHDASRYPMIEIDFPEDYERAQRILYPLIEKMAKKLR